MKKYIVRLEAEERATLEQMVRTGKRCALTIRHANILLAVDESDTGSRMTDAEAARAFGVAIRSVESLRHRLVEEGLESALQRKKQIRPSVERMFDGEREAQLIAIACSHDLVREVRRRCAERRDANRLHRAKVVP